jgi:Ca-activated chloride channel family protein
VLDNSAPVDIVSFGREEAPVSLGIVLDLSGSMRAKRNQAVSAIREIVNAAGPQDEAFLVTFSSAPEMRVEFTSDLDDILAPLFMAGARGATALIDAMYMGLQKMKHARNPRRALIVLSDGGDNNSRYTEAELSSFALESNAQIYAISIHESATNVEEQAGVFLLSKLSETTGGLHFVVRDRRDLPEIAARLATAVNNLYVIGYRPSEEFLSGKWRSLKVKVESAAGQRLHVTSRTGYFPD